MQGVDVVVIGAGASGLMCAIEAAKRGRRVVVLDHVNKAGKKILMSGGGRCNFTNYFVGAENYLSHNIHFCKSALSRYTQWDFIALVEAYDISYHERSHGQLFCNESSKDILNMLLAESKKYRVKIQLNTTIESIKSRDDGGGFTLTSAQDEWNAASLVIATGGLSIPKMGATPFGYRIAEQFGLNIKPTRAALVPFTLTPEDKTRYESLSGIAVDALVSCGANSFRENILFTHRGVSGPAILQISSYWQSGDDVTINLLPDVDLPQLITDGGQANPKQLVKTMLAKYLPKRLLNCFVDEHILQRTLTAISDQETQTMKLALQQWTFIPNGTEGYRTAEVTLGGVDCDEISSKTFEAKKVPGLYFVGEVLDVTGWLGGYNFQWAWSSGHACGQAV